MLFNPNWRKQKVADPFTLHTLIAWLEIQPPDEWYDYKSCHGCLLAQYFREHGWDNVAVAKNVICGKGDGLLTVQQHGLLPEFYNWIAEEKPHRFGSALARAKIARDNPRQAFQLKNDLYEETMG